MIIDCIADLHGDFPELKGGDLLIIAGDLTASDNSLEHEFFLDWLHEQEYRKKILVAGNHDNFLDDGVPLQICDKLIKCCDYLLDSETEFEGLKIWGSPWTKTFEGMNPHCMAFTCDTEEELAVKFSLIPDDIDILITHSPPFGFLDGIPLEDGSLFHVGSSSLGIRIQDICPRFHIFGHIHKWGGQMIDCVTTKFVNASLMNEDYDSIFKPVRIEL